MNWVDGCSLTINIFENVHKGGFFYLLVRPLLLHSLQWTQLLQDSGEGVDSSSDYCLSFSFYLQRTR